MVPNIRLGSARTWNSWLREASVPPTNERSEGPRNMKPSCA